MAHKSMRPCAMAYYQFMKDYVEVAESAEAQRGLWLVRVPHDVEQQAEDVVLRSSQRVYHSVRSGRQNPAVDSEE